MNEETQEVPKWLKELEEKREKRVKARLGHEAGAGSPCLTCEEKCPGLDLHFWRKICKNCKCGKENHDVNDDDIYGWAQFQLLGSKPNKAKKFAIPGSKDPVELEWMPKGQNEVVESYLKDLPVDLLPIKGSTAAQERKQLLQKQIPLHDIDPALCHALSDIEIKQMNDYVAHVKQNSVGVGHIMKLNELLKNRRSANAQILASRAPMQLPQVQNTVLQGADRSNLLKAQAAGDLQKGLRDLSLDEQKLYNVSHGEQVVSNPNVRDVVYDTYARNQNSAPLPPNVNMIANHSVQVQVDHQSPTNVGTVRDVNYPKNMDRQLGNVQVPNQIYNQLDYQNPNFMGLRDVHYTAEQTTEGLNPHNHKNMPHFAKTSITNIENDQKPVDYGNIRNVYPDMNVNFELGDLQANPELLDNVSPLKGDPNMLHYAPSKFNRFIEQQNPQKIGNIKDLAYSTYDSSSNLDLNNENLQRAPKNYQGNNQDQSRNFSQENHGFNAGSRLNRDHPLKYNPDGTQSNYNPDQSKFNYSPNQPSLNYNPDEPQLSYNPDQPALNYNPDQSRLNYNPDQFKLNSNPDQASLNCNSDQSRLNYNPDQSSLNYNPNHTPRNYNQDQPSSNYNPDQSRLNYESDQSKLNYNPDQSRLNYNPDQSRLNYNPDQSPLSHPDHSRLNYTSDRALSKPNQDSKYNPANYNPRELNVTEQNLNPTSVNVGIINDIEYPTVKSAVQHQNDFFEPTLPRKNVCFDLNDGEIFPSCHKCKKMFDATAIVIGIDRSDALWHTECFKCSGCNQNLADLMYFYDRESDDIYCGRDYAKIRGIPRCQACDELIFVKEYCLAENSTFHVKHFCCFECDATLAGQNYVMEDSQPLCLPCFEKLKAEKCNACLRVIKPDEQGANLNGVHFHADDYCFACKMCKKPLLGAKLLFKNRNLYCSAPCFSADK